MGTLLALVVAAIVAWLVWSQYRETVRRIRANRSRIIATLVAFVLTFFFFALVLIAMVSGPRRVTASPSVSPTGDKCPSEQTIIITHRQSRNIEAPTGCKFNLDRAGKLCAFESVGLNPDGSEIHQEYIPGETDREVLGRVYVMRLRLMDIESMPSCPIRIGIRRP